MKHTQKKAIIIGAGLSGLSSALILSMHDYDVTVCESSSQIGQTLKGFSRRGVHFDTGLHYTGGLGEEGVLRTYLRYFGIENTEFIPFDPNGFDTIQFPTTERAIALPVGAQKIQEALLKHFPSEERVISEYITDAQAAYRSSTLLPFEEALRVAQGKPEWHYSLADFLQKRTKNKELQCVLSIHCLLHGISPSQVPFLQHARVAASYFDDVHTLKGGGTTLINELVKRLTDRGVTLLRSSRISQCLTKDNKTLCGVELANGERLSADFVIYTGHPALLPDLIPQQLLRPVYKQRLRDLQDTISAYMLFGSADYLIPELNSKNLFICPNDDLEKAFAPENNPANGPFYLTANTSTTNNKYGVLALAAGHISTFEKWNNSSPHKRPADYYEFKKRMTDDITESIQSYLPSFRDVQIVDSGTPLSMRDYLHSPQGGIYGAAHSLTQFCPLPVTKISNLFLAGQSIIAPGLLGALVSAFLSCGFIIGQQKLIDEVKGCQKIEL